MSQPSQYSPSQSNLAIRLHTRKALQQVFPNASVPPSPRPKYDHMARWNRLDAETKNALPKSLWQVHGVCGLSPTGTTSARSSYDLTSSEECRGLFDWRKTRLDTPYDVVGFSYADEEEGREEEQGEEVEEEEEEEERRCDSAVDLIHNDGNNSFDDGVQRGVNDQPANGAYDISDRATKTQLELIEWRKTALFEIFGYHLDQEVNGSR